MKPKQVSTREISENILNAAEQLLAHFGFRKMTMEDVARAAGIGKGTIYLYFSSKEELVLSTIDRLIDDLTNELSRIAESDLSTAVRIKQMLVARVMFRFDRVQHYSEGINDLLAALRPNLLKRREGHFLREMEIFGAVLREGKNKGELQFGESAQVVAETLIFATNSLLPYSLSVQELGERADIEKRANRIAALLLYGLSVSSKKE